MAKQDIQTIIGSSISKDETLLKNFKSIKSCFVGWVESYNATSGTVNVQPAIQDYISNDEQSGNNYRNSPLLVNVWVLGTFKSTAIEKGDKAVCFVLDQKSNDFFKCIYDSGISLAFQTFKPKTSAQKSVCDCVCVILGDASFQEVYEAISAIDTALENKADIDGTYPNMTVGNATNADSATKATQDGDGNVINTTYATVTALNSEISARQSADTTLQNNIDAKYTKPSTGIPLTDLSSSVQTTLGQVATNEHDIADIVSGATVVGKASADGNGNNIAATYATQTGTYSNMTVGNATNASKLNLDSQFPIGSIWITTTDNNPAELFGGSWTQLLDRFLVGAGNEYTLNATGGEATHTLTTNEMPTHRHNLSNGDSAAFPIVNGIGTPTTSSRYLQATNDGNQCPFYAIEETGGSQSHNNLPPYLAVNIWRRDA